jgi:hypothetical protein
MKFRGYRRANAATCSAYYSGFPALILNLL